MQETWEKQVQSLGQEDPWEKEWQPTPVNLSGKFHGHRSLADSSPRGHKEADTTGHTCSQLRDLKFLGDLKFLRDLTTRK